MTRLNGPAAHCEGREREKSDTPPSEHIRDLEVWTHWFIRRELPKHFNSALGLEGGGCA